MFKNVKIGVRLTASFFAMTLLLLFVAVEGYLNIQSIGNAMVSLYKDRLLPIKQLGAAESQMNLLRGDIYRYTFLPEERNATKQHIQEEVRRIEAEILLYRQSVLVKEEQEGLQKFDEMWAQFQRILKEIMEQVGTDNKTTRLEIFKEGGILYNARISVSGCLENLIKINEKYADDAHHDAVKLMTQSLETMFGHGIMGMTLSILLGFLISRSITIPLKRGVVMMQDLSLGHFGIRLKMNRRDEIGVLAECMDKFADDLQHIVVGALKKIADGDLGIEITPKDADDEIAPALRETIDSLRGLVDEAGRLHLAGVEGRLSTRGNSNRFNGAYRSVVQGVNDMLDAVIGPLNVAADYVARIANGDIPAPITQQYYGDFDAFKNNLNSMSAILRNMMGSIRNAISDLTAATSQILSVTTEQASMSTELSASVSETTSTLQEVRQTAEQASERARRVSEMVQESTRISEEGLLSVQNTIDGMNQIKEQVGTIAETILNLSEQTQQIGEIIATVNDIADQSNLLALNAAIEAARAGDAGKGFAVVAGEVRGLADQSRQATAQVKEILGDIQKSANKAVMVTEEGTKRAESGTILAKSTGAAIQTIRERIQLIVQSAQQIAFSSKEQLVGMDQIVTAMENINQATVQTDIGTKQAEKAAHNLNEMASRLKKTVERFN